MTKTAHTTHARDLTTTDVDYLAAHHIETAKRLRAEAFGEIFGGLFSNLSASVKGLFTRPRPIADRPLAQSLR